MTHETYAGPRQRAEMVAQRYETALAEAMQVAYPEHTGQDPRQVFPAPTKPRADAPDPDWSAETEQHIRRLAGEFGFGRETDRSLTDIGLGDAHVVIEAGKPWKIEAEVAVIDQDTAARPASYTFTGSLHRPLGQDERDYAREKYGAQPQTEYDLTRLVAASLPGFQERPDGVDRIMPASYDIHSGFTIGQEPTGQFVEIGSRNGVPVVLMRIDRENYFDGQGAGKYRNQPQAGDVIRIIDGIAGDAGQSPEAQTPIALVTSSTYQASHEVAVLGAGLGINRPTGVATYGTETLARVKGAAPTPPAINQLPGELHVAAQHVARLRAQLENA